MKLLSPKRRYELLWVTKCGSVEFYRFSADCKGRRNVMEWHCVPKKMWVCIVHGEDGVQRCYGTRNPVKRQLLDLLISGWVNPRAPQRVASDGVRRLIEERQRAMSYHPAAASAAS